MDQLSKIRDYEYTMIFILKYLLLSSKQDNIECFNSTDIIY